MSSAKWFKLFLQLWNSVFGQIVMQAIQNLLLSFKKDGGWLDKLSEEAQRKVAELELKHPGTDGEVKWQEAFTYLKHWAAAKGLEIATSDLNFIIEAAVKALKTPK